MKITTLVVDDETLARRRIIELAKEEDNIEIVGECASGIEAISLVESEEPDLIFLDIKMPEMDGFEFLQSIRGDRMPLVIFTTAYHHHAIRAFEENAIDYLLKPFSKERFHEAVTRASRTIDRDQVAKRMETLLELFPSEIGRKSTSDSEYVSRIVVRSDSQSIAIKTEDIDWIESAGNYVVIHSDGATHILRDTMTALEKRLNPKTFLRASRGAILNLQKVRSLEAGFKNESYAILENDTRIPVTKPLREMENALRFA